MRWPFGPPHLTLKPSKKNKKKKHKTKKETKKKKNKKKRKSKKTQIYQKKSFSVISQNFLFFGWVSKIAFFDNLAQKTRTQKHYKNEVSAFFFGKKLCVTKRPFLDQKNPNSEIPVIIFWAFFLFQKQKAHKSAETPIFIVF